MKLNNKLTLVIAYFSCSLTHAFFHCTRYQTRRKVSFHLRLGDENNEINTSTSVTEAPSTSVTESPSTSVTEAPSTSVTEAPSTSVTEASSTSVTEAPSTSATEAPIKSASTNNQAKYGRDLPLPGTFVKCGKCHAFFALSPDDFGGAGKGCRVECSVCPHSWYQLRDKIFRVKDGFEMIDLPQYAVDRVKTNIEGGRAPDFMGETKLYVSNLPYDVTEDNLIEVFAKVGQIGDVILVKDPNGRSRGFGFVTMLTKEAGDKSLGMNGEDLNGRPMDIRIAEY